jgi:[ribosomal protein S5]-alanine N-acetyltransferase
MKKNLLIDTGRLIIRPFEAEDYDQWNEGFNNRLPSQYKYDDGFSKDSSTYTKEWFINWIQGFNAAAEKDEMYILGVFRKEDGVNVGKVELITIRRMDYDWAMMGYSIHNQYFRQGYGKESVIAASELFFNKLNFNRIELHINVDNEPSKKLALSTGFSYECTREAFSYEGGKWTDFLIYYKNRVYKEDESKNGYSSQAVFQE